MAGVPVPPLRVFGVDFSGARDAGRRIWICRGYPGAAGLRLESVDPLWRLPGGAVDRAGALRALVQKVLRAPRSAWGFDFPFGLPLQVLHGLGVAAGGWGAVVEAVAGLGDHEALRGACWRAAGRELRRRTDREAATPWSPYNRRLVRQTYHGIREVLAPLRRHRQVAVLPFASLPEGIEGPGAPVRPGAAGPSGAVPAPHTYVLEVCPASLLKALGWLPELGRYKGRGPVARERRRRIVAALVGASLVRPPPRALRQGLIGDPGGDALDAVLAAVAAWRGCCDYDHGALRRQEAYAVEGFVYA